MGPGEAPTEVMLNSCSCADHRAGAGQRCPHIELSGHQRGHRHRGRGAAAHPAVLGLRQDARAHQGAQGECSTDSLACGQKLLQAFGVLTLHRGDELCCDQDVAVKMGCLVAQSDMNASAAAQQISFICIAGLFLLSCMAGFPDNRLLIWTVWPHAQSQSKTLSRLQISSFPLQGRDVEDEY